MQAFLLIAISLLIIKRKIFENLHTVSTKIKVKLFGITHHYCVVITKIQVNIMSHTQLPDKI